MAFKFERPKGKSKDLSLTEHQKEYRERDKREEERFNLAVDSEFWLCFCFHDDAERAEFAEIAKADDEFFAFGDVLRPVFEEKVGVRNVRQFKPRNPVGWAAPDPLAGMEPTDSLEFDCFKEAEAILAAFEGVGLKDRYENHYDSPYRVLVIFRDRDDAERFLRDFALLKYGNKYMDGPGVLKLLRGAS